MIATLTVAFVGLMLIGLIVVPSRSRLPYYNERLVASGVLMGLAIILLGIRNIVFQLVELPWIIALIVPLGLTAVPLVFGLNGLARQRAKAKEANTPSGG